MDRKKFTTKFHNLKFKHKLLLSYALVGILPFIVCSILLAIQTNKTLIENEARNFSSFFQSSLANINDKINSVENAIQVISFDVGVSDAVTYEYDSAFNKYYQTTNYFDSILQTVKLMNPQLSDIRFYVPNNLANARVNILPISEIKEDEIYVALSKSINTLWRQKDGELFAYRKIHSTSDLNKFAILCIVLDYEMIFDPLLLSSSTCELTINGETIKNNEFEYNPHKYLKLTSPILNSNDTFTMYMDKRMYTGTEVNTLIIIIGSIIGGLIILIITIEMLSHWFVNRINRINDQLATVVADNFKTTLTADYDDEIGQITIYVNKMIKDTARMIHDVYESKLKQRKYEIMVLQAQINPHFLYNTLSAINWHAITSDNVVISTIVTSLSRFYRTALNSGDSITTIANEIENVESYVNIQLAIHSNSFDVAYNIDSNILSYKMPNLIIQPIVENAIEHGIDHKVEGRGKLTINAFCEGDDIIFEIIDNGVKLPDDILETLLQHKSKGYGLGNVNKRLGLFFYDNYSLNFSNQNETKCQVRIPKCTNF